MEINTFRKYNKPWKYWRQSKSQARVWKKLFLKTGKALRFNKENLEYVSKKR